MKTIRILVNLVYDGWSAGDLETGVGGTEEKVIELARELAKSYKVIVYHNGIHGTFDNVVYEDYKKFKPWEYSDVFISVKSRSTLLQTINTKKVIHFTSDIEDWSDYIPHDIDRVVTISDYHSSRMKPKNLPLQRLYIWADLERLDRNKVDKEEGSMLYCSSFDRGLEDLLTHWDEVKEKLKLNKLYVTYGWNFIDGMIKQNPQMQLWKEKLQKLMDREDIVQLGRISNDEMCKMYWKCKYWCLPCNNPDGELFCLNAVKSQYCESIPVVRRVGGMLETVNEFIDFDALLGQKVGQDTFNKNSIKNNKQYVIDNFDMNKQVKKWIELLN